MSCKTIDLPASPYALHIFGTPFVDDLQIGAAIPAVIAFGLLHGLSPGHGWPIAILYSMRSRRPMISGLVSSGIIAGAHFISSIAVVIVYLYITTLIAIPNIYLRYGAAVALAILAYVFWREGEKEEREEGSATPGEHEHVHETAQHGADHLHEHEHHHHEHARWYQRMSHSSHSHSHIDPHQQRAMMHSLRAIASFAFVLGFAHEEEFVILALAAGGGDPIGLMIAYASAVAVSIMGVTMLSLKVYKRVEHKVMKYSKYLPKISAILLLIMAISFATGIGV